MAKRHAIRTDDWESVFLRLQELVMANSGEDEFQEIFRLLIAKLYSELVPEERDSFRVHATPAETAKAINRLLTRAAAEWKGIIEPAPSRLSPEHLAVCLGPLIGRSILESSLEVMDNAFEFLVSQTAKGQKGQFFTPRHVIEACVRLADPKETETVVDPACGSGGFLVHALNHVRRSSPGLDSARYCRQSVWGFDFDGQALQVARALMLIAGQGGANLFQLNSLLRTQGKRPGRIEEVLRSHRPGFQGFDVVLSNPPFAGQVQEQALLSAYELGRGARRVERDVLFLERCVELARPGGRIVVVLPHNKFGGEAYHPMREWLVKHVRVVAVLGLGRHTFLPHTHQKASVLFGLKREPGAVVDPGERTLFIVSEKEGKDQRGQLLWRPDGPREGPLWARVDHDLDAAVDAFHQFVRSEKLRWS